MQTATFSDENCIFLKETGKGYYRLEALPNVLPNISLQNYYAFITPENI
jgi:hypothetical protein